MLRALSGQKSKPPVNPLELRALHRWKYLCWSYGHYNKPQWMHLVTGETVEVAFVDQRIRDTPERTLNSGCQTWDSAGSRETARYATGLCAAAPPLGGRVHFGLAVPVSPNITRLRAL